MRIASIKDRYATHDQSLYGSEKVRDLLGLLYHENSKLDNFKSRELGQAIGYFSDPYIIKRSTKPYKFYPGRETVALDADTPDSAPTAMLRTINERRSLRKYDPDYRISVNELNLLLKNAYGVTRREELGEGQGYMGYRNVPAAGGLYPLELYLVLFRGHIKPGLYHYQVRDNTLELIRPGEFLPEMRKLINAEPWIDINSANGVILMTGMIERLGIKYGERSYRFLQQETGFVTYLMSLIAHHMGLGSCVAGMYLDDELNRFIGVDGVFETMQNTLIFGKPRSDHE